MNGAKQVCNRIRIDNPTQTQVAAMLLCGALCGRNCLGGTNPPFFEMRAESQNGPSRLGELMGEVKKLVDHESVVVDNQQCATMESALKHLGGFLEVATFCLSVTNFNTNETFSNLARSSLKEITETKSRVATMISRLSDVRVHRSDLLPYWTGVEQSIAAWYGSFIRLLEVICPVLAEYLVQEVGVILQERK